MRSEQHGAVVLGPNGARYLDEDRIEGDDPLAPFSPTAAQHLKRTDGFANVADIMVGSFYDPTLDEGCAFEELISFHGGLGGPQTRAVPARAAAARAAGRAGDRRGGRPRAAGRLAARAAGSSPRSRQPRRLRWSAQDLRLLRRELLVGENALLVQGAELLELLDRVWCRLCRRLPRCCGGGSWYCGSGSS